MTEQSTLPPSYQPGTDPKAAAKAAKAYAKATRPWYKKKRWIGAIAVVAIAAMASTTSSGGESGSQAGGEDEVKTSASQQEAGAKAQAPKADNSSKGAGAITWGNWEVQGRLQVSKDALNQYDVVTRVKNTGDAVDQGLFTVTILKGTEILGTADCSTSDVNPGAVGTADCFSIDDFVPGWTEVTIENAF